jgi:hypothetical protein
MPIVGSVGTAVGSRAGKKIARRIERAMSNAAAECQAEGIADPDVVRDRMLAARQAVKDQLAATANRNRE